MICVLSGGGGGDVDENRQSTIRDQGCKIFSHLHAIRYTIGGHLPPLTCGSRFSSRAEMTMCCVLHTYSLIQPPPSFPYFFIPQSGPRPSRTASISEPPKPANANPLCVSERTYQPFFNGFQTAARKLTCSANSFHIFLISQVHLLLKCFQSLRLSKFLQFRTQTPKRAPKTKHTHNSPVPPQALVLATN